MTTIGKAAARLDISPVAVGDDLTVTFTVTENAVAYSWAGATVTKGIYRDGVLSATNWTVTASVAGTLVLALTDVDTTALGPGTFTYFVSVTKAGTTDTWLAGTLTLNEARQASGSSTASATLAITTAPAVTVAITGTVGATTASAVSVLDTANNWTGTNLESILAEIPSRYAPDAINVKTDYGATGDLITATAGGAVGSGLTAFTDPAAVFTSADVGKLIYVAGAGAAGVCLATTIAAFVSATAVTLAAAAGTSVTDAAYMYGTDDTVALTAAFAAVANGGKCVVYFPHGQYLTDPLGAKSDTVIRGAGRSHWAEPNPRRCSRLVLKPGQTTGKQLLGGSTVTSINVTVEALELDGSRAFQSAVVVHGHGTGVTTATSATFTDATAPFTAAMVGKNIWIDAAAATNGTLVTTIAAYVSATQVTLATVAGVSLTDASYEIGVQHGIYLAPAASSQDPAWKITDVLVQHFTGDGLRFEHLQRAQRMFNVHSWQNDGHGFVLNSTDNSMLACVSGENTGNGIHCVAELQHIVECDVFSNRDGLHVPRTFAKGLLVSNCSFDVNFRNGVFDRGHYLTLVQCRFAGNSRLANNTYQDVNLNSGGVMPTGVVLVAPVFSLNDFYVNLPEYAVKANGGQVLVVCGASRDSTVTTHATGFINVPYQLASSNWSLGDVLITTGTTSGAQIATAANQKLGFFGTTAIVRPSATPAAATDLATVLTLANDLRTKLLALGLIG